jgi:hypothetical protein
MPLPEGVCLDAGRVRVSRLRYFAPVIFSHFLSDSLAIVANLGIATVNFLATFIALKLVDTAGRYAPTLGPARGPTHHTIGASPVRPGGW